jgi:hypothetical protein
MMKTQLQRLLAQAALDNAVATMSGQALEGFGIVTLGSLLPILSVQLLGIITAQVTTEEEIMEFASKANGNEADETSTINT